MASSSSSVSAGIDLGDRPALTHHDDAVGDGERFLQLVADEDDALAGSPCSVFDDPEELIDLLGRQHRGRLVEYEELGVAVEHLDDLDPLLNADRQVLDQRRRVDVEAVLLGDLAYRLSRRRGG